MRNLSSHNSCNFAFFHVLGGGGALCKSQDGGGRHYYKYAVSF